MEEIVIVVFANLGFLREIYNMMFYCWDNDPQERPTFPQLVKVTIQYQFNILGVQRTLTITYHPPSSDISLSQDLEALLTQGTDYIDLNLFPEHGYYNEVSLSGERG